MKAVLNRDWRTLQEFPNYEICLDGVVRNKKTQIQIATYERQDLLVTIQLFKDGKRYLRSVKALTKRAFPVHFL